MTLVRSAIVTTFGIILLAFITSAPWIYYKLTNQDPGISSTIGLIFGFMIIGLLVGTIVPVYVAKNQSNLDWERVLEAYLRELNQQREIARMS